MNVNIVTSFVVGGILLLTILAYNQSVLNSSIETTTSVITQGNIDDIVEVLKNDLQRLGYNTGTADNFLVHEDDRIRFKGDIFDGDETHDLDYDQVTWELTSIPATSTSNPNDVILRRTWDPDPFSAGGEQEYEYVVNHFELNYYNAQGNPSSDPSTIRQVEVEIVLESPEPYIVNPDADPQYYRSVWKRTIIPNNLTF